MDKFEEAVALLKEDRRRIEEKLSEMKEKLSNLESKIRER